MPPPAGAEHGIPVGTAVLPLPLPTLVSQVLVAFTIEFDNESERQMPHRTTHYGSTGGSRHAPWLVSMVMWSNCMRFVGEEGVTVSTLADVARTTTNLSGMERWGYVVVQPDPADSRPRPPRSAWVIRATPAGRKAREIWGPLFGAIEKRWQTRFGVNLIDQLRESLRLLVGRIDADLPDCLPILGYGMFSRVPDRRQQAPARPENNGSDLTLPALLSRVLLAFAIEFERESDLSLAIGANVLRVLDEKGVLVRDLPLLTGISKEAISMALGILRKRHVAVVEPHPTAARAKAARLTPTGREVQHRYRQLLDIIEERWQTDFGRKPIGALRDSLERLVGDSTALSPLFSGLEPAPDGWRASVPKPRTLPHYPMVLHRGGFPDGS